MKTKSIIFASLFLVFAITGRAQHFAPDILEEHLKGPVKSLLTTIRTPHGRIVGQPVRKNFNEDGYFTQTTYYDTAGNPVIVISFTYDKGNRLVKDLRTLEPYSRLLSQTTYIYDKKQRTITADMFGISDSIEERTIHHFDKNNVMQKITVIDAAGKQLASTTYEYNDFGYRTLATFTEGENEIYKGTEKYRYDTEGHLAEHCNYYLMTLRQAFLYTYYYDEYGNWTQAYVYHVSPTEGYLYQIITREITYFEE